MQPREGFDAALALNANATPRVKDSSPGALRLREILVPVDFSPRAERAVRYAAALARKLDAKVRLLHVAEPSKLDEELIGLDFATYCADAKSRLDALAARALSGKIRADTKVRRGAPFAQIVSEASHSDTDLIVLCTHGHSGLQHLLLGSTAERVVRHALCPVLVVRGTKQAVGRK
jgi:nucleotide-binding universal stress UspA family protein